MELEHKLEEWVARGLITAEQADAIRSAESKTEPEAPVRRGRVSLAAEILGYFGAALLIGAFLVAFEGVWEDLGQGARFTTLVVITLLLLAAGQALRTSSEPAIERMAGVLWFGAVGSFAGVAFGVVEDVVKFDDTAAGISVGLAAAVFAWPLWRFRCAALQQVAVFAGILAALFSAGFSGFVANGETGAGVLVGIFGLSWLLSTEKGWVQPRRTGEALGSIGTLGGVQTAGFDDAAWLLIALAVAAGILGYGVVAGRNILLGLGAAGLFLFVPQFITEAFGSNLGAAGSVAVAGALIVGAAVFVGRTRRSG